MNFEFARYIVLLATGLSSLGHADDKSKTKVAEKSKAPELVSFEGCGKKDKAGKWAELYYNCKGFNGARFSPAPPCKEGFVKVTEAVPVHLVRHLQQCIYEL